MAESEGFALHTLGAPNIRGEPKFPHILMAESEGFEPPDRANGQWFSKPPHSTALPTLHCLKFFKRINYTEFENNSQTRITFNKFCR